MKKEKDLIIFSRNYDVSELAINNRIKRALYVSKIKTTEDLKLKKLRFIDLLKIRGISRKSLFIFIDAFCMKEHCCFRLGKTYWWKIDKKKNIIIAGKGNVDLRKTILL